MVHGQKRVDRIPQDRVDEVRQRVDTGREFQDAVRQVLAANAHGFNPSQQVRTLNLSPSMTLFRPAFRRGAYTFGRSKKDMTCS